MAHFFEDENRLRYLFEIKNADGTFMTSNEVTLYPEYGHDMICELEIALNNFLRNRTGEEFNKDRVMLISVTDDEYTEVCSFLERIRLAERKEDDDLCQTLVS